MRAAQSKGKVDLLALFPPFEAIELGETDTQKILMRKSRPHWVVQCKTGTARMSKQDKAELIELADQTGTLPVLAQPGPKGRGVEFIHLKKESA
jgi:hypothetical protein